MRGPMAKKWGHRLRESWFLITKPLATFFSQLSNSIWIWIHFLESLSVHCRYFAYLVLFGLLTLTQPGVCYKRTYVLKRTHRFT